MGRRSPWARRHERRPADGALCQRGGPDRPLGPDARRDRPRPVGLRLPLLAPRTAVRAGARCRCLGPVVDTPVASRERVMEPFLVTTNPMGITAVRLHYRSDPDKNPDAPDPETAERAAQWLHAQRIAYPDPNDFEREFECNWNAGHGARVFPQFSEAYHVRGLILNRRRVVFRAWDFGWWSPCCLFAQIDAKGRLCLIRELVGARQTTADFAQA